MKKTGSLKQKGRKGDRNKKGSKGERNIKEGRETETERK